MTFLWLNMLWLLLLAPVLVGIYFWLLKRRKKVALRFPHLELLKLADHQHRYRRHVPAALLLVALLLLIFAMSRPVALVTLASRGGTIIMAMDVSGSMRAADVAPTRITASQIAAKAFIDKRAQPIKIGIVGFSGSAFLVQPPTTDTVALDQAIESLRPQFTTAIGSAVVTSLQTIFPQMNIGLMVPGFGGEQFTSGGSLDQHPKPPPPPPTPVTPGSYKSAAIVLMTDGRNTSGPDPIDAARIAANLGVRIYTIGFGTANGQLLYFGGGRGMRAALDEDSLKRMATITGGQYFHATSSTELTNIYQQLTTKLQADKEETEISVFFVAGAATFALLSTILSILWYRKFF
jgi:Ca-activated chloride channel family protein